MEDIKVSVIIPVYKVAPFIRRCAQSLMNQTLPEVEFIFVDDASPDESIDILTQVLADYPTRITRIIHHDCNRGLPAARNTGLAQAHGEYVFHCDSDDFVEPTMLEDMYAAAKAVNADAVWCDWYLSMSQSERYMPQPQYFTSTDAVKSMLGGGMKFNVWNKLVRRSLYMQNHIRFPEGRAMGEDMTMIKLFAVAEKVTYLPKAYYHYVKTNSNAYSRNYTDSNLMQLRGNVDDLSEWLRLRFGEKYSRELEFLKLEVKFPFLLMDNRKRFYAKWREWYPEANAFISRNKNISLRSRMIQQLAAAGLFSLVTLYSFLLNKVYYGFKNR